MHDPLSESLPSSKKMAAKKPRAEGRGGFATPRRGICCCFDTVLFQNLSCWFLTHLYLAENPGVLDQPASSEAAGLEQGYLLLSVFAFTFCLSRIVLNFLFSSRSILCYSSGAAKKVVFAAPLFGTALSGLSNESLVAELQSVLHKVQDVVAVLSGRASQRSKTAKELADAKEANAQLEMEEARLKEAAARDKKALAKARRRIKAVEEKLKTTELERGALSSTLT